jgi:hypothetical protein
MSQPANGSGPAAPIGASGIGPRPDAGEAAFDVADLIGQASTSLGALASRAALALVCHVSSAPLRVQGKRQRCLESLLELVTVAAVPQAGGGELRITAAIDGAYVEVAVTHIPMASGHEHLVGALCLPRCRLDGDDSAESPVSPPAGRGERT